LHAAIDQATDQIAVRTRQALFEALGPAGLGLLADSTGDGRVTVDDVQIVPTADQVQINLRLGKTYQVGGQVGFDLGLPWLGLQMVGEMSVQVNWDLKLGFGMHRTLGFYFDTTDARELNVNVEATIRRLDATGRLGLLRLRAQDLGSRLNAGVAVDVRDP